VRERLGDSASPNPNQAAASSEFILDDGTSFRRVTPAAIMRALIHLNA
jgi:hypothetical protein